MKAEAIPEEFKLSSASTRFSLLLLPFLVLISCKKEKLNSNQALHQKIAGNYKLIKTEVKEGSPVILLIDGQVHDLKILATYQWSNFPYKFFE